MTPFYKTYIKSPAWQKKRAQVFSFYGKRCYACRTAYGPIQIHHLSYDRLGNEPMSDLIPLCRVCHTRVTKYHRSRRWAGQRRNTLEMIRIIRAEQARLRRNGRPTR